MDRQQVGELFRNIACSDVSQEYFDNVLVSFPQQAQIVDGFGFPAINCAAMHGNDIAIAALLKHGVDPNTRDPNSHTPLMIALRGHGVGFKRSVAALLDSSEKLVDGSGGQACRDQVNVSCGQKMTAAHYAARAGESEALERLVELGADIQRKDSKKRTPLHHAAIKARFGAVQSLLNCDATADVADSDGNTPILACALELAHLHEASHRRRLSSVGDASAAATATTTTDGLGMSTEDKREEDWRIAVVELLLAAGADPRRTNNCGQSIQMLSKRQRWLRIALGLEEESSSPDSENGATIRQRSSTISLTVPNLRNRKKRVANGNSKARRGEAAVEEVSSVPGRTDTPPMRDSSMDDETFETNDNDNDAEAKEEEEKKSDDEQTGGAEVEQTRGKITWAEIKRMVLMIILFAAARYAAFHIVGWWYSSS